MTEKLTTKATRLNSTTWGCRVLENDKPIVEVRVNDRTEIGPAFKDMLRMLDKCGVDSKMAHSSRHRNKPGSLSNSYKFFWKREY